MRNLDSIRSFLKDSRRRFLLDADRIPDSKWRQSPAAGVWCGAEIVAHVGMVEESIIAGCEKTLQKEPRPVSPRQKLHLPLMVATWRTRKIRSPMALTPQHILDRDSAYAALDATRQSSLAFMASNAGRDLSAYRFPHPIFGSLNLYDWYRFIGYHELRHRKQICELVEIFHR
jgi:hypothetical protein